MNRSKMPGTGKWVTAVLAFSVTFGGAWAVPSFGPIAHAASVDQTASSSHLSYWNSVERAALVKMLAICNQASSDFYSDPDNARYQAIKLHSDSARILLLNPASSPAELNLAYANLDSALTAYIEEYIRDASILERQTFQMARMLNDSIGTTPGTYPQDAADKMFAIIEEAQAVVYNESSTVSQFCDQYRKYIEGAAALNDSMNFDRADRLNKLNTERQTIEALAANASSDENSDKLVEAFKVQADELDKLLNGTSGLLAVEAATRCVQSAYNACQEGISADEGIQLANELDEARKLYDLPKGIRSGQYPNSAFGELRKAVNKSALTLSRNSSQAQLSEARASLVEAVAIFHSKLRP
ncbi:hypothetical protein [Saccharibacillus kuerlensis]|uniref:DUF3829 domain-containing protein n=1 Tax=Saccharibacillus kuerlensis TaxID=459527 RepID=A0ABQ2KS85_9BACL|nr:hypothetical protein [Saccharibacillus kuerlensis]GGN91079.1 hypothetical protein GCM10010969_02280 [Saccharibacillus kuerlensis]